MAKIGVLVLHGMGNQKPEFAEGMIEELYKRLKAKGYKNSDLIFKVVYWAPVFQEKETELMRHMKEGRDLDFVSLREFVIYYLADAIAYQKVTTAQQQIDVYQEIRDKIAKSVKELYDELKRSAPGVAEFPMVVMAHSLGCQMISNYIWDVQHDENKPANAFERMENLSAIMTFGCNIPLFTIAYNKLLPITFLGINVNACFPGTDPVKVKDAAKWVNFYDKDDILGYPL